MKVLILSVLTGLFFQHHVFSQTPVEKNERPTKVFNGPSGHGLGVVGSSSNGKGLAYRYWPQKFGFHVSFLPATSNEYKFYNGGITGYAKLKQYEVGTLFLHAGIEYQYNSRPKTDFGNLYNPLSYTETSSGFNIGAGPGLHVFQKFISMDIYVGYAAYIRNVTSTLEGSKPKDQMSMTVTGGVALFLEL